MVRAVRTISDNGKMGEPERLIDRYHRGYSTASELMLGVLTLRDENDVRKALQMMPKSVLKKVREFVGYYTPDTKVFKGPPPNLDTVAFVRGLLGRRRDTGGEN